MTARRLLILNGALRGASGNTAAALRAAVGLIPPDVTAHEIVLADFTGDVESLACELRRADALLLGTGVYWGSWGSPLQRFLEVMTGYELSDVFLGKPVGVIVTMDSVGGTDVAQRLLGVLATMGCLIPPLPMVVVSRVATALKSVTGNEDVWQVEDVEAVVHNLFEATRIPTARWRSWGVARTPIVEGTYPGSGALDAGLPRFLELGETKEGQPLLRPAEELGEGAA